LGIGLRNESSESNGMASERLVRCVVRGLAYFSRFTKRQSTVFNFAAPWRTK
jgi:hypothetical protein